MAQRFRDPEACRTWRETRTSLLWPAAWTQAESAPSSALGTSCRLASRSTSANAVRASVRVRSGSRSASAAASTCLAGRAQSRRRLLIGCEPFRDGVDQGARAPSKPRALGNIRLHADDARPLLRWLPAGCLEPRLHPVPRSLAEEAPQKRRLVAGGNCSRELARACARRRAAHRHRHRRLRAHAMLLAVARAADFRWQAAGPARLARPRGPTGHRRATSKRPSREGRRCYFFRFRRMIAPCGKPPQSSRLRPVAQFSPNICLLMIISTLRVGPWGPLFLFWRAIGSASRDCTRALQD